MMKIHRSLWVAALGVLAASAVQGQDAAQKEIRERRDAFTKAMTARKGKEVVAFMDPSMTWKTKEGETRNYKEIAPVMEKQFDNFPPGATLTARIDKLDLKGDTATLTLTETFTLTDPQGNKQEIKARSIETWKKIKGKWMLVKNEEL